MSWYGTMPAAGAPRASGQTARQSKAFAVMGMALVGAALVGLVLLSARTETVLEASRATTFSEGTTGRAARVQQLSDGAARDDRAQVDTSAETRFIGSIPVDETLDAPLGMSRPLGDVKHLDCAGRDEDPECQTSVMPLFDKASTPTRLTAKDAGREIDAYFAQQQTLAAKTRSPIKIHVVGTNAESLKDPRGTKFGLSAVEARKKMRQDFPLTLSTPAVPGRKARVSGAQMLRNRDDAFVGNNSPAKVGTLVKFSASEARGALNSYFEKTLQLPPHSAANGHLKDKARHEMHGESTVDAMSDINAYFSSMAEAARRASKPGRPSLATAPLQQPNMEPESDSIGDVKLDKQLDTPLFQGYKTAAGDDASVDDKVVDASKADCAEDQDCASSRSPLLNARSTGGGGAHQASVARMGTRRRGKSEGLSARGSDADLDKYFSSEEEQMKAAVSHEERAAAKIGLSGTAARERAKAFFNKQQQLAEYGLGPEDDHKIVVKQAMGVDAMMPESVFEANPEPASDTVDEVNEAIQAQRNEGYTNGDGAPAEDIALQ